jgi:hypothetical protein
VAARWSFNGEAVSGGEEMGRRNGESGERNSGANSFCHRKGGVIGVAGAHGGGGGGGTWSDFQRKKTVGLTDREGHLSVRGRRRADWARKGGRRWATAGLEKEGGGRAESIARAEIQNSKRKSILNDFWIKIGLEIE